MAIVIADLDRVDRFPAAGRDDVIGAHQNRK
jgi:hypothetical protein